MNKNEKNSELIILSPAQRQRSVKQHREWAEESTVYTLETITESFHYFCILLNRCLVRVSEEECDRDNDNVRDTTDLWGLTSSRRQASCCRRRRDAARQCCTWSRRGRWRMGQVCRATAAQGRTAGSVSSWRGRQRSPGSRWGTPVTGKHIHKQIKITEIHLTTGVYDLSYYVSRCQV